MSSKEKERERENVWVWDKNFVGVIIKESLENKSILKKVKILSTENEKVTERHQTPWLSQWTLHTVEIPESKAKGIVEEISKSLDPKHSGSWVADFKMILTTIS